MDVLVRMVEHHVWLTGELIERGARLDAATLDRPFELSPRIDDLGSSAKASLVRFDHAGGD